MTDPVPEPARIDPTPQEAVVWLTAAASRMWDRFTVFFGAPMDLLARGFLSRTTYDTARDWILHLERLVLRIVTLAALALDLPAPATAKPDGATRSRPAPPPMIAAHRPHLVLFPASREGRSRPRRSDRAIEKDWMPVRARGLARRLEALRRALRDIDGCALKVARRLVHIAANREDPDTPVVGFRPWCVHSSRMSSAQFEVNEAMIVTEITAATEIERWHARLVAPS